jgi:hypothetical protein
MTKTLFNHFNFVYIRAEALKDGRFFPQATNLLFRSAAWRIKLTPVNFG